jgi:ornithine carbamoyltransferase
VKQTVSSYKKQPKPAGAKQKGRNCSQARRIDEDMMRERNIVFAFVRCLPMSLQYEICDPVRDQEYEIANKLSAHDLASV